jgi:dienelactone hydrolase
MFKPLLFFLVTALSSTQSVAQHAVGERFSVPVHSGIGSVEIDVWLSLPAGGKRVPLMLLMHSSGGLHIRDWENARQLNNAGIATAVVDSFGPRRLRNVWQNKQSFTAWTMAGDGFAVLRWLESNPRIDPARIGAMGRSLGGEATIYMALAKARRLRSDARALPSLALAVAIYPGCVGQWRDAALTPKTHMHFFLAAKDDLTPAAHCVEYSQRMRSTGGSVAVFTFPDAYHSFDTMPQAVFSSRQENYSKCRNEWRDNNDHIRLDTGAQIAGPDRLARYLSECKTMGGWVGGNPRAARELSGRLIDLAVSQLLR